MANRGLTLRSTGRAGTCLQLGERSVDAPLTSNVRPQLSAPMRNATVRKLASRRTLRSDLAKVDAHVIRPHEYEELPALSDSALARAIVNKGSRLRSANPRKLISIRLPVDVIDRWKATGPGWQTRMADRLSKAK